MIPLIRGPEPEVLKNNALAWTAELHAARLSDPDATAQTRRYGHAQVREALRLMSARKCFYCESAVSRGSNEEIDHYIEQSARPDLAYTWDNLYLSCHGCNNGKPSHAQLPVTDCVDPCDPATSPPDHLMFVDEQITEVPGSSRGRSTIRKYRLDRENLAVARQPFLNRLHNEFRAIVSEMMRSGAIEPTAAQRARLRVFANPSRPFSAMLTPQVDAILSALEGR